MTKKAIRRLTDIDFSKEGCHVSIVGKSMGGAANGFQHLVLKSLSPQGINNTPLGASEGSKLEMIEKSAVDVMVQKAVDEAVAPYKQELDELKAAQVVQVEKARKEKIVAILGTATAEDTFMAIKSLDDKSFEMVLKGFEVAKAVEAKSDMFVEKGASSKEEVAPVNTLEAALKNKYSK